MKRIFILLFLLSNITWLTGCAAVDPAVQNCVQKNVTFQELPGELRARIICKMFPELVQFLTNHYANKARLEIASFEPGARIFGINRLNSQLIIARYRYDIGGVGTLVTWDLNTHRPLQHRTFNESNLEPLIIPNKNKIAVIDIHHQASLLDMNDFTKLCDLGEAFNMAISQDETRLVTVNYQTFCLWDVETGRKINEFPHALNECLLGLSQAHLAMNSCGTKLALATFDTIYIIDLITGRTFLKILPVGCTRYPQFSSDGTKLYAEVDRPGAFFYKAWDVATGNKVIERNFGGDDVNIRGKIRIEQNDSLFSVYNDETDHLLFSHSERMRNFIIVDNWFIADILGKPKTYIWKLDTLIKQINSLNFAFGLISKRQLFLLDAIRKSAEHDKKFKLNQNNPDLKKVVQDYDTLPDPIKDVVQEYVTIV